MSLAWLAVSGLGLVTLVVSVHVARRRDIPPWEVRVFQAVNRLPRWLYGVLWPPMQLGNLVVGTVVGLSGALAAGSPAVAVGVIIATVLKLVTERIVRHVVHGYLTVRQRPGTSQPGAVLRGSDVPSTGPSFPSGHVLLVAAVGCVIAPTLPNAWIWVPFASIALVMLGLVYVGAHNPLDVTAGLGAGLVLGGILAAVTG
jgi:membrane-associated phospholipid phosphatase